MDFSDWVNPFEKMNEEQLKHLAQLGSTNFYGGYGRYHACTCEDVECKQYHDRYLSTD
jgi:hypothetical protein